MRLAPFVFIGALLGPHHPPLQAQSPDSVSEVSANRKNAVVLGLGGNAPAFSLNYHRQLLPFKKSDGQLIGFLDIGVGIGLEFTDLGLFGGAVKMGPAFPHSFTANFGRRKHFLEVGYGGAAVSDVLSSRHYIYMPLLGWRFKGSKAFLFRLHFSPWVYQSDGYATTQIRPMFGLSLGKSF